MPRPRAPKVPNPTEELTPPAEDAAETEEEEEDSEAEVKDDAPEHPATPPASPGPPTPNDLKIVISLKGERASIGIQRPGCDPFLLPLPDAGLTNAIARLPEALVEADALWQGRRQNPKYARPAPPPRTPAAPRAARTPPAPAVPAGPTQGDLFG